MTNDAVARVVLVTTPDAAVAESLVRRLVQEGVVACGNILPGMTSIYRWKDAVEHEQETLILFKTTVSGARRLVERVPALHPYEVPEVLVLPVEDGHAPYLEWVSDSVSSNE